MTRPSSATEPTPPTRCACGAPRRRRVATSRSSIAATTTSAVNGKMSRRTSPRCCIRTTSRCRARSCACEQQYFFVSCSLQDMLRIMHTQRLPLDRFHEKFAVQLNDTHPAIAVAELMRMLVDEHRDGVGGRPGTSRAHVRLHQPHAAARSAGALAAGLFGACCRAISRSSTRSTRASSTRCAIRFRRRGAGRADVADRRGRASVTCAWRIWPASAATPSTASRRCTPNCSSDDVLKDFHELWPDKFSNKTNGVTPRRFVVLANPRLSPPLICDAIGDGWITDT
jgi:starch phosphorylase